MIQTLFKNINSWDNIICLTVHSWNGKRLFDQFIYWISKSGDGYLYVLTGLFFLFTRNQEVLSVLFAGLIAFAIELPVHAILKKLTKRKRPFNKIGTLHHLIKPPKSLSFPSGHSAAAFIFATLIKILFPSLAILLYSWAGLVGFSRVYLGVHYPSDVIVGMVLGFVSVTIGLSIIF